MEDIKKLIRDVPDFPKPGILFKDITPLLSNPDAFRRIIKIMGDKFSTQKIDKVVGVESRGFLFGTPLALELNVGFVPVRKRGKLPWTKISEEYTLEYGTDHLEMHADAVAPGERVLILDDVLATGGTAQATARMIEKQKAVVASFAFVVELDFLDGRSKLQGKDVFSVFHF
jgi:adenine phosphoribosyltransferase